MRLLIYGSKEFALTVAELARHCGYEVAGMVDDYNIGLDIVGNLEHCIDHFPSSEYGFAIAIGYSNILGRWKAWERIKDAGYQTPSLIHSRAYVADSAQVGEGSMIMAGAIIDVRAEIGDLVVVWPNASINHDASIGSNTFVSPGVTVCGFSSIGKNSFIGAGSVIADHCQVPQESFLKMLTRYTGRKS